MKEAAFYRLLHFHPPIPSLVSVAPGPPVWFVPHLPEWDFALDALTAAVAAAAALMMIWPLMNLCFSAGGAAAGGHPTDGTTAGAEWRAISNKESKGRAERERVFVVPSDTLY